MASLFPLRCWNGHTLEVYLVRLPSRGEDGTHAKCKISHQNVAEL